MWPPNPVNRPSPEEARQRRDKIMLSPEYLRLSTKITAEAQARAIEEVTKLNEVITGKRVWLD